jgi:hypothetical protein
MIMMQVMRYSVVGYVVLHDIPYQDYQNIEHWDGIGAMGVCQN